MRISEFLKKRGFHIVCYNYRYIHPLEDLNNRFIDKTEFKKELRQIILNNKNPEFKEYNKMLIKDIEKIMQE